MKLPSALARCLVGPVALLALFAGGCGHRAQLPPTVEVRPQHFVHEVRADGLLEAATVTAISVPSEVQASVRLAWLAPEGPVAAGDLIARFDERPFREKLADAGAEIEATTLETVKTRSGAQARRVGTTTDQAVAELELERSERHADTDDAIFSRREIAESAIDAELARERRRQAVAGAGTDERLAAAELAVLAVRDREARRLAEEARSGLDALEVHAPHAGVFVPARTWRGDPLQVGNELWRGQPIGEIPDLTALRARVFVLEADAGGVVAQATAEVVVEARPDRILRATVEQIEPVAKPRLWGSPVQFFGVVLALEEAKTAGRPGQRLRARLVLADLEEALAVPRQAIVRDGEVARVWVVDGDKVVERKVTLGPASLGRVVVAAGLEAGERVVIDGSGWQAGGAAAASPSPVEEP